MKKMRKNWNFSDSGIAGVCNDAEKGTGDLSHLFSQLFFNNNLQTHDLKMK